MPGGGGRSERKIVIGYQRGPQGPSKKIHDVTIFADTNGDPDLIQKVVFRVGSKATMCHCPVRIAGQRGRNSKWRFFARLRTRTPANAQVIVRGRGGAKLRRSLKLSSLPGGKQMRPLRFKEPRVDQQLRPVPIANKNFGIELELTSASDESAGDISSSIGSRASVDIADLTADYALANRSYETWKLMSDSSIICHRDRPDCSRWELVSRILQGGDGLHECDRVVRALESIASIRVNKSMGFHVHVDVSSLSPQELVRVCQAFVAYEGAIDSFMPPSRQGSDNRYCKSNRVAVAGPGIADRERMDRLAKCRTIEELAEAMNPSKDRYFKLNLQNLRTGRQQTIEFRQHSATSNATKVKNWVRFCMALVQNSAAMEGEPPLSETVGDERQFNMLFEHIIKDRVLWQFYRERRNIHTDSPDRGADATTSISSPTTSADNEELGHGWEALPCRLPVRPSPSERAEILSSISLQNRSAYFELSSCPVTVDIERRMEAASGAVSDEAYAQLWERGRYDCARCGRGLYASADKFRGPCLWPSFRKPREGSSLYTIVVPKGSYNEYQCEVRELYCGGCCLFLGHQFADGRESGDDHPDAGDRHCVLSLSLTFSPTDGH